MNRAMKFLSENKDTGMQTTRIRRPAKGRAAFLSAMFLLASACCWMSPLFSQVPSKPQPPRLVNDLAGIFTAGQIGRLEQRVDAFADTTSNQIAIVTVPQLYGMDKAQLAYSIGQDWGVGQKKFDNGVVILIKPKKGNERGEVFIATGYGLEGVLTDAISRRIIEQLMIPAFRQDDYFAGVENALDVIFPLVSGEISTDEFARRYEDDSVPIGAIAFFIFIVAFVIMLAVGGKNGPKNMGGGNGRRGPSGLDMLLLGSILGNAAGRGRAGGFGSGIGGGFGGGGFGGFGGFGGGSFGGGGAGGSW